MTEPIDPVRRREKRGPDRRETIEELYGDVVGATPIGLFDTSDEDDAPPRRDASHANLLRDDGTMGPGAGGASGGGGVYHPVADGAPGSFARHGKLEYPRKGGDLTGITLLHGLATLFTLGIWRFWLKTAQRRSVWAHTKLAGEPFEYTGSGLEMFIGAMIAVVFLGGMLLATNMALLWLGYSTSFSDAFAGGAITSVLTIGLTVMLLPLIEYARFRARRYRLRRTRWRGIRCDMRGSGLGMVGLWLLWAPVVTATLGLALPFLHTARERFMTNRTMWGTEPFFFRGSAWRLMPAWVLIWAMMLLPAVVGTAHVWHAADARAEAMAEMAANAQATEEQAREAAEAGERSQAPGVAQAPSPSPIPAPSATPAPPRPTATPFVRLDTPPPPPISVAIGRTLRDTLIPMRDGVVRATRTVTEMTPTTQFVVLMVWLLTLALLALSYRAALTRVFMNARRIAGVRARCTFGADALLGAYLAVLGRSIWPGIGVSIGLGLLSALLLYMGATNMQDLAANWRSQGLVLFVAAINYGGTMLFGLWLMSVVYFRAVHHWMCAATTFEGLESLDVVRQRARAASAEAEGLADAFDVDVGF
ncbi:MAG: uncharacterized membrane protein YjgN (DUF898 family) [Paracoccaceae bacterium]|jgi:uncharacterized membrane protein YjgN (DUF898 family)